MDRVEENVLQRKIAHRNMARDLRVDPVKEFLLEKEKTHRKMASDLAELLFGIDGAAELSGVNGKGEEVSVGVVIVASEDCSDVNEASLMVTVCTIGAPRVAPIA